MTEQARSGELGPDAVVEGGDTPTERRCTFMEAALALAGGLDDGALATLHKAARPGLQVLAWLGSCLVGWRGGELLRSFFGRGWASGGGLDEESWPCNWAEQLQLDQACLQLHGRALGLSMESTCAA